MAGQWRFSGIPNGSKDIRLFLFAAEMAARGIATIGINAVGHGDGPLERCSHSNSWRSCHFPRWWSGD